MIIGKRYGDLFQMSYVTRDLDAAMAHADVALGISDFRVVEADIEVLSYGKPERLHLRAAMAYIGTRQFEIIEPIAGATRIYTDDVDLSGPILSFHHTAIAVRGDLRDWQSVLAEIADSGDALAYLFPARPRPDQTSAFCYVDTRDRIGHHTEFLWIPATAAGGGA